MHHSRAHIFKTDGRQLPGPIGGYATLEDGVLYLTGLIMSEDGNERYVVKKSHNDPVELGNIVADEMEKIGAKDIIDMINENNANQ